MKPLVIVALLLLTTTPALAQTQGTFFDSEWPSPSLLDVDGLSTGLTHRLPGTGAALPTNNPNLDLEAPASVVRYRSQTTGDLTILDMPGIAFGGYPGVDGYLLASYLDVRLNPGQEFGIFAGVDANNLIRFGFRPVGAGEAFKMFAEVVTNGVVTSLATNQPSFQGVPGQHSSLMMGRGFAAQPGEWFALATSGGGGGLSFGTLLWDTGSPLLYGGVFHTDAGTHYTANLSTFYVTFVPEPSTYALAAIGVIGLLAFRRRMSVAV